MENFWCWFKQKAEKAEENLQNFAFILNFEAHDFFATYFNNYLFFCCGQCRLKETTDILMEHPPYIFDMCACKSVAH
jgi:hypothetical protein